MAVGGGGGQWGLRSGWVGGWVGGEGKGRADGDYRGGGRGGQSGAGALQKRHPTALVVPPPPPRYCCCCCAHQMRRSSPPSWRSPPPRSPPKRRRPRIWTPAVGGASPRANIKMRSDGRVHLKRNGDGLDETSPGLPSTGWQDVGRLPPAACRRRKSARPLRSAPRRTAWVRRRPRSPVC